MPRNGSHVRRTPKSNPRGKLRVFPEGYGFVQTAEGEFFIPARFMKGAFDGDVVDIVPIKDGNGAGNGRSGGDGTGRSGGERHAKVVQVVSRAHESVVGRVEVAEPFAVVIPADPHITHDIFTLRSEAPDVPDGALVRVTMVTYPDGKSAATGVISEVLADAETVGVTDFILAKYHVDTGFSPEAETAAREACLDAAGALAGGYRDLRGRVVFTVDPADAKDYDDAVSFETGPDGARIVGVHIADVSAYVPAGGPVDRDAARRGTSIYAVDRVVPMLPEALSDGLCSLVAGEDRLTLTVDMTLDAKGEVTAADVYPAVIRSRARLTYDDALAVLRAGGPVSGVPGEVAERLTALDRVAEQRRTLARARGALDFNNPELRMILDESGAPADISLRTKNAATSLIEECMIMANVAVARFLLERGRPGVFRVHEAPDADALAALLPLYARYEWFSLVDTEAFALGLPTELAKVLRLAGERDRFNVVGNSLLRAMKRAEYRPACDGHYGLGLPEYCHFTSPIRRYPDLVVHRAVKAALGLAGQAEPPAPSPALCKYLSEAERVAESVARESQQYKLLEYMQRFVGQRFTAVISGVSPHCLYVRLENTAEGTVELSDLGSEYFSLDLRRQALLGESSGREYCLGDVLSVVLFQADPKTGTLRFKPK